ncbi:MAG: sigma-54-dependent Fis family transcriptional regulator [Sphingosinicella sp.]|nr:sigma-54-dependent Fis family transcriptional regulator [Sphingosinicella sp.]
MPPDFPRSLLLIDVDQAQHRLIASVAARAGWQVQSVRGEGAEGALASPRDATIFAAFLGDWNSGDTNLLARLRDLNPDLQLLVCTDGTQSVDALRAGASDVLARPLIPERLAAALGTAADRRKTKGELRPLAEKPSKALAFSEIVGSTPEFRTALAIAAKAARTRLPVLIEGERGSGKESLAQAIHAAGPRSGRPMIVVDCGSVIPNLLESWLFGHEKGAFPGAFDRFIGRLENADGTTIFLKRIEDLPLHVQARLVDAIDTREVRRLGGRGFKSIDLRIIVAADKILSLLVERGQFREDLYLRLAPASLTLPPLRERRGDIPLLARHLLARIAEYPGMRPIGITDDAISLLMRFGWPGNVRQLRDSLFRAALVCEGTALTAADFPKIALETAHNKRADDYHAPARKMAALARAPGITLYQADGHLRPLEQIEADVIRLAIGHYQGRMTEVARRLGIGRSTLYRKLAELGISDAA